MRSCVAGGVSIAVGGAGGVEATAGGADAAVSAAIVVSLIDFAGERLDASRATRSRTISSQLAVLNK